MLAEAIAQHFDVPVEVIKLLAATASHRYKEYEIPKRTGGRRTIHHPARPLKAVQRLLLRKYVADWPVHGAALAYRAGVSTAQNAYRHRGAKYSLRIDITNFFPSLTGEHFRRYVQDHPNLFQFWDVADVQLFESLVMRRGRLTIGAPTSPSLSNCFMYDIDTNLVALCGDHRVRYTRYADDMFFSARERDLLPELEPAIVQAIESASFPAGLLVNPQKTHHRSAKGRQSVTGLVLTSQGSLSIGRERKRVLRAQVHQWETLGLTDRETLSGMLAYVQSVEPNFIERLMGWYGEEHVLAAMGRTR